MANIIMPSTHGLQEARCIETLSESEVHKDSIGYYLYESTHCLVRTRRDLVVFTRGTYIVSHLDKNNVTDVMLCM